MSYIKKVMNVKQKDGSVSDYNISLADTGDSSIIMTLDDGTMKNFSDDDLFKSLKLIRAFFEKKGAKVLCNGSRVDVYPSGMSRGMGKGRKAYVLILGKQARINNLVDIFDYADASLIGTIEEQECFYKQWITSLG